MNDYRLNLRRAGLSTFLTGVCLATFPTAICGREPPVDKAAVLDERLTQATEVDFQPIKLSDACQYFQDLHGLEPIEIDQAALQELGLKVDAKITFRVRYAPLYNVLPLVMQCVSSELDVLARDGRLVITSTKRSWCTVRYNVRELTTAAEKSKPPAEKRSAAAELRELVLVSVFPESWREGGGKGEITVAGDELVVQNFARQQWAVRELLVRLQKDLGPNELDPAKTVGDKIRILGEKRLKTRDANGDGVVNGAEYKSLEGYDLNQDQEVTLMECIHAVRTSGDFITRRKWPNGNIFQR